MGFAVRKDVVRVLAAVCEMDEGVCVAPSSLDGSGVVGREGAVLNVGRNKLVNEGLGGKGVGGLL